MSPTEIVTLSLHAVSLVFYAGFYFSEFRRVRLEVSQILEKINGLEHDVTVLKVKLGGDDGEQSRQHGRRYRP